MQLPGRDSYSLTQMKKLILLLILLSSISAFSQDSLHVKPPKVFSRPVPIIDYIISWENKPISENIFFITTRLFVLKKGQNFFEIFAKWENTTKKYGDIKELVEYQNSLAKKELQIIGFHE